MAGIKQDFRTLTLVMILPSVAIVVASMDYLSSALRERVV